MSTSFYTELELKQLGLKSYGQRVLISKKASIYSSSTISIGNNVRIDDYCIISGNISIGSNVHISAYVALYGAFGIVMEDYTGISPRATIYSAMDDFSGEYLIGPIHKKGTTNVRGGIVIIKKYAQVGANSIVFPDLEIGEGAVVGAASLVKKNLDSWGIYAGIPIRKLKERNRNLLNFTDEE